jgi:hypothetical protein
VLGMVLGSLAGSLATAVWNLWSVDLPERGIRRKVCGFVGLCVGGFIGVLAGVLYRVL